MRGRGQVRLADGEVYDISMVEARFTILRIPGMGIASRAGFQTGSSLS